MEPTTFSFYLLWYVIPSSWYLNSVSHKFLRLGFCNRFLRHKCSCGCEILVDSPCVRHTSQPCCHRSQNGPRYRGRLCCGLHTHEAIYADVSAENAVKCYTLLAQNHLASHQHLRHTGQCIHPHRDIPMQVRYTS